MVEPRLNTGRSKRLQNLDMMWPGIAQMHKTVEGMKRQGLFKGEVYGPLAVEMELKDDKWPGVLEMVSSWYLCATVDTQTL